MIVSLEGPPGAGKTTSGGRLARHLGARFWHAFDVEHPVVKRMMLRALSHEPGCRDAFDAPAADDPSLFTARQWERVDTSVPVVFEGIFQTCLEYLYLAGASLDAVVAEHARLVAALGDVTLIHFAIEDLDAHLDQVIAERGATWVAWLGSFFARHRWARERGLVEPEPTLRSFYRDWARHERALAARHERSLRFELPAAQVPDAVAAMVAFARD